MKGLDESIVQWSFLGILSAVNEAYQIDGGRPRHSEAPIRSPWSWGNPSGPT